MARPQKIGLDYFPLDVDMDHDDKVAIIEAQHGLIGFAIVVKLLMKIYSEGYHYEWSEKQQILFAKRVNVDINEVNAVIDDAVRWGLFDKNRFEAYGILTSRGIQMRYFEIVKRRKRVEATRQYLLLEDADIKAYTNLVIVDINPATQGVKADINPQSKEKKSKEKKKRKHAHSAGQDSDGDVEADEVTVTSDEQPDSKPRQPFKTLQQQQLFDQFWLAYPKRRAKGQAEKTWCKMKPDRQLVVKILAGLERAKASAGWAEDDGRFIPYPSTWLNAKGWEDEYREVIAHATSGTDYGQEVGQQEALEGFTRA